MRPTVMRGFSDEYGSWKTIWMSARYGRIARRLKRARSAGPEAALIENLALDLDAVTHRAQDVDDGAADGRLAAAGFADEPERLAATERERDAVDRSHLADAAQEYTAGHREAHRAGPERREWAGPASAYQSGYR